MKTNRYTVRAERGSVMVVVLLVVFLMGSLTILAMGSAKGVSDRLGFKQEDERLTAIGEAVIDMTMADLWAGFLRKNGGTPGNITLFRKYLDESLIFNEPDSTVDMRGRVKLPIDEAKEGQGFAGAFVHDLSVTREDQGGTVLVRVSATVGFGPSATDRHSREIERGYYVAGEEFRGFDYGLLSNNVNCIMCHAQFDNAERFYNRDADRHGTFGRVRVGTLESMRIRADKTESNVAGTIYTRGAFIDKDGTLITGPDMTDLTSVEFTADGLIQEDGDGALSPVPLELAAGDPLPAQKSLYLDYPSDPAGQVDGSMPTSFPPVIPDGNGNRVVDDDEMAEVVAGALGTLTGGYKAIVAKGMKYADAELPGFDYAGDLEDSVNGHLILTGTQDNPFVIRGRVVVDGDLVLTGVVKGSGEIIARGNVYIVGPLSYLDGTDVGGNRTFGLDPDGSENRLTLGAGGNILVGDFLMTKKTANGDLPADDEGGGAKNNNGHGNNEDGVDASNPGQSKAGEDTDPTVDDEMKGTINLDFADVKEVSDYLTALDKYADKLAALDAAIANGKQKDIDKAQKNVDKEADKLQEARDACPVQYWHPPEGYTGDGGGGDGDGTEPGTEPLPEPEGPREIDPRAISGTADGLENFTASEVTLFNRMEWTKTRKQMPDRDGKLIDNPLYIEGYVPRYYNLYPENPVYLFNYDETWFDATTKSWLGKEHISGFGSDGVSEFLRGSPDVEGAVISSLMPDGDWLTDTQLIDFWVDVTQNVPEGTPFALDAVLYSNNSVMFLARKATTYAGQAIVNGALIAADLGILVPGDGGVGLQLNYDTRHIGAIRLRTTERVSLVRGPRFR